MNRARLGSDMGHTRWTCGSHTQPHGLHSWLNLGCQGTEDVRHICDKYSFQIGSKRRSRQELKLAWAGITKKKQWTLNFFFCSVDFHVSSRCVFCGCRKARHPPCQSVSAAPAPILLPVYTTSKALATFWKHWHTGGVLAANHYRSTPEAKWAAVTQPPKEPAHLCNAAVLSSADK